MLAVGDFLVHEAWQILNYLFIEMMPSMTNMFLVVIGIRYLMEMDVWMMDINYSFNFEFCGYLTIL